MFVLKQSGIQIIFSPTVCTGEIIYKVIYNLKWLIVVALLRS